MGGNQVAYILDFRRYAPFTSFGGGFHGDGRSSANFAGTFRTRGVITFDPVAGTASGVGSSGVSYHVAAPSIRKTGTTTCAVTGVTKAGSVFRFTAATAGALPLIPGAPDIDTFVDFTATISGSGITFSGTVRGDNFPNAEVFVYPTGALTTPPAAVFHFATTGDRNLGPMTRLAGSHASKVLGSFTGRI